jgi:hypothetical protein
VTGGRSHFIVRPAEPVPNRTFASGTHNGDRSDRTGLRSSGSRELGACSGVAWHRSPRKPAATRDHEPTRHVCAPPDSVPSASSSSRLSIPLLDRAEGRGRTPARFNHIGTSPPGRWSNARRSRAPAPQSKPVAHASRLVTQNAPSVAFGLGVRIPAAGPAHSRLYSPFGVYAREPQNKSARTSPAGIGGLPATRQARLPPTTPAPQSFSHTATRADRKCERQQGQPIRVDRPALPAPGRPHRRSPVRGATVTTLLLH